MLDDSEAPFNLDLTTLGTGATRIGTAGAQSWFMPLGGAGMIDGAPWSAGQCWLLDGTAQLDVAQGRPGPARDALKRSPTFLNGMARTADRRSLARPAKRH